jgi:hypothetical protein
MTCCTIGHSVQVGLQPVNIAVLYYSSVPRDTQTLTEPTRWLTVNVSIGAAAIPRWMLILGCGLFAVILMLCTSCSMQLACHVQLSMTACAAVPSRIAFAASCARLLKIASWRPAQQRKHHSEHLSTMPRTAE